MIKLQHIEDGDKYFLVGTIVLPLIAWWYFKGSKKYGVKGMK